MKTQICKLLCLQITSLILVLGSSCLAEVRKPAPYTMEQVQKLLLNMEGINQLKDAVRQKDDPQGVLPLMVQILKENVDKKIACGSDDETRIAWAVAIVGDSGDVETSVKLLKPYLEHSSKDIRDTATSRFMKLKHPEVIAFLETNLKKGWVELPEKITGKNARKFEKWAYLCHALRKLNTPHSNVIADRYLKDFSEKYGNTSEGKELLELIKDDELKTHVD